MKRTTLWEKYRLFDISVFPLTDSFEEGWQWEIDYLKSDGRSDCFEHSEGRIFSTPQKAFNDACKFLKRENLVA